MRALVQSVLPLLPLSRARNARPVILDTSRILQQVHAPQEGDHGDVFPVHVSASLPPRAVGRSGLVRAQDNSTKDYEKEATLLQTYMQPTYTRRSINPWGKGRPARGERDLYGIGDYKSVGG